jgi:hypothetical protein
MKILDVKVCLNVLFQRACKLAAKSKAVTVGATVGDIVNKSDATTVDAAVVVELVGVAVGARVGTAVGAAVGLWVARILPISPDILSAGDGGKELILAGSAGSVGPF